ncbi:MAG: ABC transporter permease, partial [Gemmatimonadota bacterium]
MGLWHGWMDRARSLLRRDEEERALREEIRFHIERETAKLIEEGRPPGDARREAHLRFGGVERTRARTRDERGTRAVEEAMRDVRFAFRSFLRAPGPTATALLTVALGIGGTTAMFGVVDGVLLRPLPFADPGALVAVWEVSEDGVEQAASYWNFDDWRREVGALEALAALTGTRGATVMTRAGGARAGLTRVSADFFEVLGVPPLAGRLPGPDENRAGGPAVAVVGERFWRDELGAPAALEGVTVGLEGEIWDVVGVLPGTVDLPAGADVWLPLDRRVPWSVRGNHVVRVVGRLGPG